MVRQNSIVLEGHDSLTDANRRQLTDGNYHNGIKLIPELTATDGEHCFLFAELRDTQYNGQLGVRRVVAKTTNYELKFHMTSSSATPFLAKHFPYLLLTSVGEKLAKVGFHIVHPRCRNQSCP